MELNSYILNRMGWEKYNRSTGIVIKVKQMAPYNLFEDDDYVKFFFIKYNGLVFLIKESDDGFAFMTVEYKCPKSAGSFTTQEISFNEVKFKNNQEMLKLIMEKEACLNSYARNFRINKVIRKQKA